MSYCPLCLVPHSLVWPRPLTTQWPGNGKNTSACYLYLPAPSLQDREGSTGHRTTQTNTGLPPVKEASKANSRREGDLTGSGESGRRVSPDEQFLVFRSITRPKSGSAKRHRKERRKRVGTPFAGRELGACEGPQEDAREAHRHRGRGCP